MNRIAGIVVGLVIGAIALYFLFGGSSSVTPAENTFRNTTWGMSREEVKTAEAKNTPTSVDKRMIRYTDIRGNIGEKTTRVDLVYGFEQSELVAGCYGFNSRKAKSVEQNQGAALKSYRTLKNELNKDFGAPAIEKEETQDATIDPSSGERHLLHNYFSVWRTETVVIELKLRESQPWLNLPFTFDLCYIDPIYFGNRIS